MQFVNLFGTPKNNKEKARFVRSHVMRLVRKRRGETLLRETKLDILPALKKSPAKASSKARKQPLPEQSIISRASSCSPRTLLPDLSSPRNIGGPPRSETIDNADHNILIISPPWQALPISSTDSADTLPRGDSDIFDAPPAIVTPGFQHWLTSSDPQEAQSSFEEAYSNFPFLGANSSCNLSDITLSPTRTSNDIDYLAKGLHQDLRRPALGHQSGGNAIESDETTIAAFACHTNLESLHGNSSSAYACMEELKSLVEIKGGIAALNESLRRLVQWIDLCHATRWQLQPSFPYVAFPNIPHLSDYTFERDANATQCLGDRITNTAILSGYSDLIPVLESLHELTLFLEFPHPDKVHLLHGVSYVDHVYISEYRNLMMMAYFRSTPLPSTSSSFNDISILPLVFQAITLFIYTNIRLTLVDAPIRCILVDRIHCSLSSLPTRTLHSLFQAFPYEMMWIFFLTGSAALRHEDRTYFVDHLKWMCGELACDDWDEVVAELRRFLWIHTIYLERCKDLWTDIESQVSMRA
ncbi:hypothetical protein B0O99DRAFT_171405 [Bisporella sp. PMI_857]|nr:hypothetical protein B0O99DRAFT_171405 [Bisporella sp. PMI_857]